MDGLLRNRVPRRGWGEKGVGCSPFECFLSSPPGSLLRAGDPRMGVLELGLADSHMI